MRENIYDLLAKIEYINTDERSALEGWYQLWSMNKEYERLGIIEKDIYDTLEKIIIEGISEEEKHSNLLSAIAEKISNVYPENNHNNRKR